jgi:ADP-heptose:LPS heptosyltransferase
LKHILVIRFSSLGDIAMTIPVIKQLLETHPQLHISFLSVPFAAPLFEAIPRCTFIGADLNGKHKGIVGIRKLYKEISA